MNVDTWIALGGLATIVVGALITLAMRIAKLQADATNRDDWIRSEVESRKAGDQRLEDQIKQETVDRRKVDSDFIDELKETNAKIAGVDRHVQRYLRRKDEMERKPHDSDDDPVT